MVLAICQAIAPPIISANKNSRKRDSLECKDYSDFKPVLVKQCKMSISSLDLNPALIG